MDKTGNTSEQTLELAMPLATQLNLTGVSRPLAWLTPEQLRIDLNDAMQRRFGDYELVERIGQGGMGVVYRARQHGLERDVAIKLLAAGPWASEEFVARFRTEARSAARMQHPNIVEIYEFGHRDGLNYFSMRLVDGPSLAERLVRDGRMSNLSAAPLMRTLAEAIDYAHQLGVLHLDLKPANVLIGPNGEPLIADFGLARRIDAGQDGGVGEVSGTPSYMAPEQALLESHPLSASTDIYGLGAILYEMLTGRPPFVGADAQATLASVIANPPRRPRALAQDVSLDLEAICLKCLEKEPAARYGSARQLADDLGRFLEGRAVSVRPLHALRRFGRWVRREPKLASAVLAVLLALAVGLTATSLQWRRADRALADAEHLGLSALLPAAFNRSLHRLALQIHGPLAEASRRARAKELSRSADSRDWMLAGLIGETLPEPDDLEIGDTQLRRSVLARPSDRLALMAAIRYCGEKARWIDEGARIGSITTCPVSDAPLRLSRLDPGNLYAWMNLIDPPALDESHRSQLLWQYRNDPDVRARTRALLVRAARSTHWNDGYGDLMRAKSRAYGVGYFPMPSAMRYTNEAWEQSTASAESLKGGIVGEYSAAWALSGLTLKILPSLCNPEHSASFDPEVKDECLRIHQLLGESKSSLYANVRGWEMLSVLGKGTPVGDAARERLHELDWFREQSVWTKESDPVASGTLFVRDLARFGQLEANLREMDRLGIPRKPPTSWKRTEDPLRVFY